jgi:hypothetical protein
MDRRLFLTGMLGVAGAAAVATALRPVEAVAGVPNGRGILDELEGSSPELLDEGDLQADIMDISHRRHHHHHRRRRRHRRRVWRRVCRRFYRHGRWHRRCRRERVWVWHWGW